MLEFHANTGRECKSITSLCNSRTAKCIHDIALRGCTISSPRRIVSTGFITVSNHHFGSIDGLILCDTVVRKRKDYKLLTTFQLSLVPNLKEGFLPVDNLSGKQDARSINSIRTALRHIADGGAIGFFPADIPHTLRELARLREIVFRAVGEGSSNALDTDIYDTYYKPLIVWNVPKQEIAGAYRIGFGDEVMARAEKENAFYTSTLFQFQKDLLPYLPKAMELGRTIGPVSTTNDLPLFYKSLVYHFILKHYSLPEADQLIRPTHPLHPDFLRVDPDQLLVNCHSVDDLDRLVCTLSDGRFRLPVLLRKYII